MKVGPIILSFSCCEITKAMMIWENKFNLFNNQSGIKRGI